ncbi:MAG: hypothetical protein AB8G96_12235 [Phycisphaerales bacterium]
MPQSPARLPFARLCVAALLCGGISLATGCEDGPAADRAAADTELKELSQRLQLAAYTTDHEGDVDQSVSKLQSIARDAAALNKGSESQIASAALLAAEAHRQLADLHLSVARQAESEANGFRTAAESLVSSASRLNELAASLASADIDEARALITAGINETNSDIDTAQAAVDALDGPITERNRANTTDRGQAEELNREANDLRRSATDAGPRRGLPSYRRAIELEQEADGFEFQIARRENELAHDFVPQFDFSSLQLNEQRASITRLESALSSVNNREQLMQTATRELQSAIGEFRSSLGTWLDASDPAKLEPWISAGVEHAQQAASLAGKARAADPSAATSAEARAHASLGELLSTRAIARERQAAVAAAAANVPPLNIPESTAAALRRDAGTDRAEAIATFTQLIESVGGNDRLAALERAARRSIERLGGEAPSGG